MYFQRRGNHFSFIYYDTTLKKNVRLHQQFTLGIDTEEKARAFCKDWDQKMDALKMRLQRKHAWKNRYHDWIRLLETFEKVRKEEASNSWDSDVFNLESYIFPFFLEKMNLTNLRTWEGYLEDFRDYLLECPAVRQKGKDTKLAYASRNNIISSLNAFLLMLYRRREIDRLVKCRHFPRWRLNRKNDESVMSPEQQQSLFLSLKTLDSEAALFFWISLHTGLRLNEMLGLSLSDVFTGEVENIALKNALKPFQMPYFGYIVLESQPLSSTHLRLGHRVPRKPLKGKKSISYENARMIPIFDKQTFNYLASLRNTQATHYQLGRYGSNPQDYLLFENLTKGRYSRLLRLAQERLLCSQRFSPHDTRHTYSTWLVQETGGNFQLCQMILGHSELETTQRYVHVNAQLNRRLKVRSFVLNPFALVD